MRLLVLFFILAVVNIKKAKKNLKHSSAIKILPVSKPFKIAHPVSA